MGVIILNFLATGLQFENSSCLKVPDVGIQNDRSRTTITTQQTEKKNLSLSARENVRKLFKSVQPIIMTKLLRVLVYFAFQQTQILFFIVSL